MPNTPHGDAPLDHDTSTPPQTTEDKRSAPAENTNNDQPTLASLVPPTIHDPCIRIAVSPVELAFLTARLAGILTNRPENIRNGQTITPPPVATAVLDLAAASPDQPGKTAFLAHLLAYLSATLESRVKPDGTIVRPAIPARPSPSPDEPVGGEDAPDTTVANPERPSPAPIKRRVRNSTQRVKRRQ